MSRARPARRFGEALEAALARVGRPEPAGGWPASRTGRAEGVAGRVARWRRALEAAAGDGSAGEGAGPGPRSCTV